MQDDVKTEVEFYKKCSVLRMTFIRLMYIVTIPLAIIGLIFFRFYRAFSWSDTRLIRWFFLQDAVQYFTENVCKKYSDEALEQIKGVEIKMLFKDESDAK